MRINKCVFSIAILILISLSGCLNLNKKENDKIAVSIVNETDDEIKLDITIRRDITTVVYNETVYVEANEFKGLGSIIDGKGTYQIRIQTDNNLNSSRDDIKPSDNCGVVKIWIDEEEIRIEPEYK